MNTEAKLAPNVKQVVPFFMVSNLQASLRYYVDGLGFRMVHTYDCVNSLLTSSSHSST